MKIPEFLNRDLITGPYLQLCLSQAEFDAVCDHVKVDRSPWIVTPQSGATMHTLGSGDDGAPVCVVCLKTSPDLTPVHVAGILAHEAVHVWQAFRDYIGERHPSNEFEAYSIQIILQRLMWAYEERAQGDKGVTEPTPS